MSNKKALFPCEKCGKQIEKWTSQVPEGTEVFCSNTCQKKGEDRTCPTCGKTFYAQLSAIQRGWSKYCSRVCSNPARGMPLDKNPNWGEGRFVRSDGYVAIRVIKNGKATYPLEHDVLMEQHLGRKLTVDENVHHKNHDRSDNRLENLELVTRADHIREHHPCQRDPTKWVVVSCDFCGKDVDVRKSKVARNPLTYCNRACYCKAVCR